GRGVAAPLAPGTAAAVAGGTRPAARLPARWLRAGDAELGEGLGDRVVVRRGEIAEGLREAAVVDDERRFELVEDLGDLTQEGADCGSGAQRDRRRAAHARRPGAGDLGDLLEERARRERRGARDVP